MSNNQEKFNISSYPNGTCGCGCPYIGGKLFALHCENADPEDYWDSEPDARPIKCRAEQETVIV
jgi:hypothetical protein